MKTNWYVESWKPNTICINEFEIDNYIERMQQPLISDKLKKNLKTFFPKQ